MADGKKSTPFREEFLQMNMLRAWRQRNMLRSLVIFHELVLAKIDEDSVLSDAPYRPAMPTAPNRHATLLGNGQLDGSFDVSSSGRLHNCTGTARRFSAVVSAIVGGLRKLPFVRGLGPYNRQLRIDFVGHGVSLSEGCRQLQSYDE